MVGILVAKWVADAIGREGVYDVAQNLLGHPFFDLERATQIVQGLKSPRLVDVLIPPKETMDEITVVVPPSNKVPRKLLEEKLRQLKRRGLMDAGLVLVQESGAVQPHSIPRVSHATRSRGILQGYLAESELEFGLSNAPHMPFRRPSRVPHTHFHNDLNVVPGLEPGLGSLYPEDSLVRLLGDADEGDFDLSMFVDRTPPVVNASAPLEYAIEMFGKLGLRHLCVLEEGTGGLVGIIIKKRLVGYLEHLAEGKEE